MSEVLGEQADGMEVLTETSGDVWRKKRTFMFQKADKKLVILSMIALAAIIIPIIVIPTSVVNGVGALYAFMTSDLAWLFLWIGVICFVGAVLLIVSKWGDIRLGGKDAVPHYKTFTWISMMLCSSLAAGILIFGMCEWMYYVTGTPFGVEPGSAQAYEYASAYGMFHWGFSAWAFYLLPGVAIGYLYWNKKKNTVRISVLCEDVLTGAKGWHKPVRWIIDLLFVLCYFVAVMTTVGIGTPVLGELLSDLTGIPNSFALKIGVIIIFCVFFTLSTSKSIAKGMGKISDFNIWLAILFFAYVLVVGDTSFILNNITMAVGTNIREFVRMSFNSDAIMQTGFVQNWTIFYWAWYVALAALCGTWVARTSYGRTLREITIANTVLAPLACWITFGILGNYGMALELFHGVNLSGVIGEVGNNGVTLMVLKEMPFAKLCIVVFFVLIFFNLATTCTANGTSLSMYTSKNLQGDEEPSPMFKTFWCFLFLVLPVGILLLEHNVEGLNVLQTIQSMITVSALPVLFGLLWLFYAFVKQIRKDIQSGELLDAIPQNKQYKWENLKR